MGSKKILITGVAGFIGYHLAKNLLADGYNVFGIDNLSPYYDINLKLLRLKDLGINDIKNPESSNQNHKNFQYKRLDISDTNKVDKYFQQHKFDLVCHLAAQAGVRYSLTNPLTYVSSNLVGFFNIIENCKSTKVKKLIYASSSSVYGNKNSLPFNESMKCDAPESFYAATKKSNELIAYTYGKNFDLESVGLRFFTVYGEFGRPDMSYFKFLNRHYSNQSIKIYNHGKMFRDFTYINDIVNGINKALFLNPKKNKDFSRVYNLGSGSPVALINFIELLEKVSNITFKKEYVDFQKGDVKSTHADITSFKQDYPSYKIKTKLEDGLNFFNNWYKTYNS